MDQPIPEVAAATFPSVCVLSGATGTAEYKVATGWPVDRPYVYTQNDSQLSIVHIDVREYLDFWALIDDGSSMEINVSDIGYTDSNNATYAPDMSFRAVAIIENNITESLEEFLATHDAANTRFTVVVGDGWGETEPFSVTLIGTSIHGVQHQYFRVCVLRPRHAFELARHIAINIGEHRTKVEISLDIE